MPAAPTRVVLKVDVDTCVGLVEGAGVVGRLLEDHGVRGSFFVAMGPDHSGWALKRVVRPGFILKQLRSRAGAAYGMRTMAYGLLLPAPVIARRGARVMRRLVSAGHEVGVHGWDHVMWHERMRCWDRARIASELAQAVELFREVMGFAPKAFASPGWQVTPVAYEVLQEMGFTHTSCVRGTRPFRPMAGPRVLRLVELPTTVATMDELMAGGLRGQALVDEMLGGLVLGGINVITLHAEVEGRVAVEELELLLEALRKRGVRVLRMVEAAWEALREGVGKARVGWARVGWRAYEVAVAGDGF